MTDVTFFEKTTNNSSKENNQVSIFKDPFTKTSIKRIDITYRQPLFEDAFVWEGQVSFVNGLTSGKQETPKCSSWDELMIHMKQIYDSLSVKI